MSQPASRLDSSTKLPATASSRSGLNRVRRAAGHEEHLARMHDHFAPACARGGYLSGCACGSYRLGNFGCSPRASSPDRGRQVIWMEEGPPFAAEEAVHPGAAIGPRAAWSACHAPKRALARPWRRRARGVRLRWQCAKWRAAAGDARRRVGACEGSNHTGTASAVPARSFEIRSPSSTTDDVSVPDFDVVAPADEARQAVGRACRRLAARPPACATHALEPIQPAVSIEAAAACAKRELSVPVEQRHASRRGLPHAACPPSPAAHTCTVEAGSGSNGFALGLSPPPEEGEGSSSCGAARTSARPTRTAGSPART